LAFSLLKPNCLNQLAKSSTSLSLAAAKAVLVMVQVVVAVQAVTVQAFLANQAAAAVAQNQN
jgi:hypothetical protein